MIKILFIGLASSFTPGMTYQDNYLCDIFLEKGCDVSYVSNPEQFEGGVRVEGTPEDRVLDNGLRLIRLPYKKLVFDIITKKIRAFSGLYDVIDSIKPDIIYCHNFQYYSIKEVIKYKKKHFNVKLYVDCHAAYYNSGTNFISRFFLHRLVYRNWAKKLLPFIKTMFYIGEEEKEFAIKYYHIPESSLSFFPLGGIPCLDDDYFSFRKRIRKELKLSNDELLLIHTGKINKSKKTDVLLKAFSRASFLKAKLIIIGSISNEFQEELFGYIKSDKRILFLGWKNGKELQQYLCASDIYCQPGSVSATLQNAICQRCAIVAYPFKLYKTIDFGQFVFAKNEDDIFSFFNNIYLSRIDIGLLKSKSVCCANELLDYHIMANNILKYDIF